MAWGQKKGPNEFMRVIEALEARGIAAIDFRWSVVGTRDRSGNVVPQWIASAECFTGGGATGIEALRALAAKVQARERAPKPSGESIDVAFAVEPPVPAGSYRERIDLSSPPSTPRLKPLALVDDRTDEQKRDDGDLSCAECGGTGFVLVGDSEGTETCDRCRGTGREASAP